ncbi:MAG: CRR6 family NdhI maturation factor [Alkalinema sp. FL-bin-369]|nr:CRR6 family NdhI maturation factor [Leptolyngbyaceae cyanobacterium LF-bin-369]
MSSQPIIISVQAAQIHTVNTIEAEATIDRLMSDLLTAEKTVQFDITFEREATDPRELSEIAEIRLWFIRLDAKYPWLPFLLDWQAGELARYVAMLVPHQFHIKEGIQFNPEALEIFVMQKVFILMAWFKLQGIPGRSRVQAMTQMLGYELEDAFFDVLGV